MPTRPPDSTAILAVVAIVLLVGAALAFYLSRRQANGAPQTTTVNLSDLAHTRVEEAPMAHGTFATAINCIDGRAQAPVADWMKIHCHADYVDVVTIPGPDRALTHGHEERKGHIHEYVTISVNAHGSRVVAVAGHHDCAANPVSREEHIALICQAAGVVSKWQFPAPVRVVGLWVNEWWQVEVVADTDKEQL